MRSAPLFVTPGLVQAPRRKTTLPAARGLDYATWHAHIAGAASATESAQPVSDRHPARMFAEARLARPAA